MIIVFSIKNTLWGKYLISSISLAPPFRIGLFKTESEQLD